MHSKKVSRGTNGVYKSTWKIKEKPKTTLEIKGTHWRPKKFVENMLCIVKDE
jgi:hypothetical protein